MQVMHQTCRSLFSWPGALTLVSGVCLLAPASSGQWVHTPLQVTHSESPSGLASGVWILLETGHEKACS